MASFQKYFDDEIRYLNERGSEFSREFPDKARHLNMSSPGDRDPYIERLFEGFAFLTGRVQQRLDDDFPEVAENLLDLVAPEFLRPIPSLCMLEMNTRRGMLQKCSVIPKGSKVLSNPVGKSLTACEFRTTRNVDLFPLELKTVNQTSDSQLGNGAKFNFSVEKGAEILSLTPNVLTMYVSGERSQAWTLIDAITSEETMITIEIEGKTISSAILPKFSPGGFKPEESLFPGDNSSIGYEGFLHEYFSFDEKFRFIELNTVDFLKNGDVINNFSISIFSKKFMDINISDYNGIFKLFVSPVINLFTMQANPINLDLKAFDYFIRTEKNRDIYCVEKVVGIEKNTGKTNNYRKFSDSVKSNLAPYVFKRIGRQQGIFGGKIALELPENINSVNEEYLSITIKATDGSLPRQEIPLNGLHSSDEFPQFVRVTNITRPTSPIYPPDQKDYLWYVLSHLSVNLKSLCQGDNLRKVLELYNWANHSMFKKMTDDILESHTKTVSFVLDNAYIRGTEVTLKLRDSFFENEGEINSFGRVIIQMLSRYVSINYLVSLRFVSESSEKNLYWKPLGGQCSPL